MNKAEIAKLIHETTNEVLLENSSALEGQLDKAIEIAVQLSYKTNIRLLQKLGILEDFSI